MRKNVAAALLLLLEKGFCRCCPVSPVGGGEADTRRIYSGARIRTPPLLWNMTMRVRAALLTLLLGQVGVAVAEQSTAPFGWDLSYRTLFKQKVPENDTVARYYRDTADKKGKLAAYALPPGLFARDHIADADVAVLVDTQAFWYFSHRMATLYVKTSRGGFMYQFDSKSGRVESTQIRPERIAALYDKLVVAEPAAPSFEFPFEAPKGYVYSGYGGAVSLFRQGNSTQFLITPEDILRKNYSPGRITELIRSTVGR